jgi:hypothetical protein
MGQCITLKGLAPSHFSLFDDFLDQVRLLRVSIGSTTFFCRFKSVSRLTMLTHLQCLGMHNEWANQVDLPSGQTTAMSMAPSYLQQCQLRLHLQRAHHRLEFQTEKHKCHHRQKQLPLLQLPSPVRGRLSGGLDVPNHRPWTSKPSRTASRSKVPLFPMKHMPLNDRRLPRHSV